MEHMVVAAAKHHGLVAEAAGLEEALKQIADQAQNMEKAQLDYKAAKKLCQDQERLLAVARTRLADEEKKVQAHIELFDKRDNLIKIISDAVKAKATQAEAKAAPAAPATPTTPAAPAAKTVSPFAIYAAKYKSEPTIDPAPAKKDAGTAPAKDAGTAPAKPVAKPVAQPVAKPVAQPPVAHPKKTDFDIAQMQEQLDIAKELLKQEATAAAAVKAKRLLEEDEQDEQGEPEHGEMTAEMVAEMAAKAAAKKAKRAAQYAARRAAETHGKPKCAAVTKTGEACTFYAADGQKCCKKHTSNDNDSVTSTDSESMFPAPKKARHNNTLVVMDDN